MYESERGTDYEIYTINKDGSGRQQVTDNDRGDLDPAWSPNGKRIAYSADDGPRTYSEIYTIRATGGGKKQLTDNDNVVDAYPNWSPDGQQIVYRDADGDGEIYTIKATGGGRNQVTHNARGDFNPDWGVQP